MDLYYGIALSLHLGLNGDYNFVHPHVGVDYNDFMAGVYYNSEFNSSAYVGYRLDLNEDANLELGVVSGYSGGDILPMIKLNYKNLFASPSIDEGHLGIVTGIDWRF